MPADPLQPDPTSTVPPRQGGAGAGLAAAVDPAETMALLHRLSPAAPGLNTVRRLVLAHRTVMRRA
ncbi:hypothetical protein EAH89_09785 [Roseomonas nepalensis]|uniref:Uncharacterized protein n=1 Tax=Muricoccus nepalensis TaxID=1854500 RepID=A0A502G7G6_9PROT|nr:hypothetical protein [Roseomonas nepalensis]TPG57714.1 hypothetical protein EAH89_09785 [Roseomonas nepalensis]